MEYKELLANEKAIGAVLEKYNPSIEILVQRVKEFATPDEISGISCSRLYAIYCEYCSENLYPYPRDKQLGSALKLAYGIESRCQRVAGVVQKVYLKQELL